MVCQKARDSGIGAQVSEVFWTPELRARDHRASLERSDLYTCFEAFQVSSNQIGWQNWDVLQCLQPH